MEQIRIWAFSVCTAAVAGALINMLMPQGGISRTLKTVICVFFLCVIISPLADFRIPKTDSFYNGLQDYQYKESEKIDSVSEGYLEKEIINSVNDILKSEGISAKDIFVKINISESGGIDINKFVLTFDGIEDPESIEEKIYKKTGIRPKIILSGES